MGLEIVQLPSSKLSATFVRLDQGNTRIPSVGPTLNGDDILVPLPLLGDAFRGEFDEAGDIIVGTWEQSGVKMPLRLENVDRLPTVRRPQEPKPPFPYESEEVVFKNTNAGHSLAGTLTLPRAEGPHPALVLVTGSGPQDRDETIMGHKPFAVLADALTRHGIAVLRYDDRGVGGSQGDFSAATTVDLAEDAHAAVRYLSARGDIASGLIGLAGHSEGAMIAPMLAAKFPNEIAFIVLLAPPALTGEDTIVTQGLAFETRIGMPKSEVLAQANLRRRVIRAAIDAPTNREFNSELRAAVKDRVTILPDAATRDTARSSYVEALAVYRTPWFRYFLAYDPTDALKQVACPVLAVIGEKDVQVVSKDNLPPLQAALAAAPTDNVRVATFPHLNHLLQTAETGLPAEYGMIEETIAPAALELITDWVSEHARVDSLGKKPESR